MPRAPRAAVADVTTRHPNVLGAVPAPVAANPNVARTWCHWNRFDGVIRRCNLYVDYSGRRSRGKSEGYPIAGSMVLFR